jgi:hypothetical protein
MRPAIGRLRGCLQTPVLLLTALALIGGAARPRPALAADPPHVVTSAHADILLRMLAPMVIGEDIGAGCRIEGASLERESIRLTAGPTGGAGPLSTLLLRAAADDEPAGTRRSRSFLGAVDGPAGAPAPEPWPACVDAVWQKLAAADDGTFWAASAAGVVGVVGAASRTDGGVVAALAHYRLQQVVWVGLIALGLVLLWRRRAAFRALPPAARWLLPAALVVGVALRALWAEPGFLHENYCGVARIACADVPPCHSATGNHGWASFTFYNLVLLVSGGSSTGVFAANVLIGGLVLPFATFLLGRALFRDDLLGALAAVCVATSPVAIRVSASEEWYSFAPALVALSLVSVVAFARAGGWGRALLAAVLVALVVQTARVLNLQPALALAVFLLARPQRAALRPGPLAAGVAVFAALAAWHYVELFAEPSMDATRYVPHTARGLLHAFTTNNLFVDLGFTPLLWALAWVVGVVVAFARDGRAGAVVLLGFVVYGLVLLGCDPTSEIYPTRVRMQASLVPFVALFAGAALRLAVRWRWGTAAVVALALGSLAWVPRYHAFLREPLVPALEGRFWQETIPRLPEADVLVTLDDVMAHAPGVPRGGDPVETHFPLHELRRHYGRSLPRLTVSQVLADPSAIAGRRALFYQAPTGHAWLPEELRALGPQSGPRPDLSELRQRFELQPVEGAQGTIPNVNPPTVRVHYGEPAIPVGFYWLVPRPEPAPAAPGRPRPAL